MMAGDNRGLGMAEQLRLMAVHAHPDDESSKGAATMAKYVAQGVDVHVVTCTGGEGGSGLHPQFDPPGSWGQNAPPRPPGMGRAPEGPRARQGRRGGLRSP